MTPNTISKIIVEMQDFHQHSNSYFLVSSLNTELSIEGDFYEEMSSFKDIFFFANRSRVILVVWICQSLRVLFEKYKYADINLPYDAYDALRQEFNTKSCSRQSLCELFGKNSPNCRLSYDSFVEYEQKYIQAYNKLVPEEYQMSLITHIVPKKKEEIVDLAKSFKLIFANTRDFNVLYKRAEGLTLDDLGSQLNVTRERTRQIEAKPKLAIKRWIEKHHKQFIKETGKDGLVIESKAMALLGEKEWKIFKYVLKTEKETPLPIKYDADLHIIFEDPDNTYLSALVEAQKTFDSKSAKQAQEAFSNYMQSRGFAFFTPDLVATYFKNTGKYIYGDTICNGKANLGKSISLLVANNYPNGIKITDKNELTKFASELKSIYKINTKVGRSLTTRIQDVLVMRNRGTYDIGERINFPEKLRNEIYDYIDYMPNDRITYELLFKEFKDKLIKESNIDNPFYLHGALKFFNYENDFVLLKCYICKSKLNNFSSEAHFETIKLYLLSQNGPVKAEQILADLPDWNEMFLKYSLLYFPEVVLWSHREYINLDVLKITDEDKVIIKSVLDSTLKNKYLYTSSYKVFEELKVKNKAVLDKYKITNDSQLFHIIQYCFLNEYSYRKPHILSKDKNVDKGFNTDMLVEEVVNSEFPETLNKVKLLSILEDLYGSKNSSINLSLQRVLKNYIKTSSNNYINKNKIVLSASARNSIVNIINNNLLKGKFFITNFFNDYDSLPKICCKWNPCILCEIISIYNLPFKILGSAYNAINSSTAIIVPSNSEFSSKEDVLKYLIENDMKEEKTLKNIYKYIKTMDIYHANLTLEELKTKLDESNITYIND